MTDQRPVASPETGYYGLPVLKKPVWTWEIPTYFFVGGIAGPAAVIAAVADGHRCRDGHAGGDGLDTLVRDAHWIAAGGGLASAALLISDLGRPERFVNMLRVFKPQSPMSVGSWLLMAFSSTSAATAMASAVTGGADRTRGGLPVRVINGSALGTSLLSAVGGSVLATYTGVLIGSTAIPVWNANARLLPLHFGTAGLGSAASLLELLGHDDAALHHLAIAAAAIETAILVSLELDDRAKLQPLKTGRPGTGIRVGGLLTGPVPLALLLLKGRSRRWRRVAGACSLAGSLLSRLAWIGAGRASARDPRVALEAPRTSQPGSIATASESSHPHRRTE